MNKNAIKKFAIEARTKLIASVTDKAGMLGITEKSCSEPLQKVRILKSIRQQPEQK